MSLKMTNLKIEQHLPGANELIDEQITILHIVASCFLYLELHTVNSLRQDMTSSNKNTSTLLALHEGNSPGNRWIPLTKASDAKFWGFLSSESKQTVEQTIETPVIWDAIALIMTSL